MVSQFKIYIKELLDRFGKRLLGRGQSASTFKNVAVLSSGTALAKLVALLLTPIVTRIYTPEDFAFLALFSSTVAIITPLITFRYSVAIPLPGNTGLAVHVLLLSVTITCVISMLFGTVFYFAGESLFGLFSVPELAKVWWLIGLGLFFIGIYESFTALAVRQKHFKTLSKLKVYQSLLGILSQIGFGLLGFKPLGLLIGNVMGQSAGLLTLFRRVRQSFSEEMYSLSYNRLKFVARRYAAFPKYQIASRFLLALSSKLPLLFVAYSFDPVATGQLALSLTVVAIPMSLVGESVGKAYYSEIAALGRKNTEAIRSLTDQITKKLLYISLIPFLMLLIFSPILFSSVFGEKWTVAGWLTSALSLSLISQFISSPINNVLSLFSREAVYLKIQMVRIFLVSLCFAVGHLMNLSLIITIILYSLILFLHRIIAFIEVRNLIFNE